MNRIALLMTGCALCAALAAEEIALPKPQTSGGMPLADALAQRKTTRKWSDRPLPMETVSSLLWAAWGVTRPDGKRTAPTAMNRQEYTLYAAIPSGIYRYDAAENKLVQVSPERYGDAPLTVILVADLEKQREKFAWVDGGFIGQNIYLFCAANHLATVFRARFDNEAVTKLLKLGKGSEALFVQAVGFPAE